MKIFSLGACAAAAFAVTLSLSTAGEAAPGLALPAASANGFNGVTTAQYWRERGEWRRRGPNYHRRDFRPRRFRQHRGAYFYNGHRGYRERRHGYRFYNGWWFPPAAFGLMMRPRPPVRDTWGAHVAWCHDRWKSYRASDNSYQPYQGSRRQCVSPYGG